MARLFISYSNADAQLAKNVAEALQALGHYTTMDTTALVPGDDWRAKLDDELKRSDGLVALLTTNSVTSSYVSAEIGSARNRARETGRMLIVPVIADNMAVPPLVSDLFAVIAPDRDAAKIAAQIHRAIELYQKHHRSQPVDHSSSRDRTIGLILAATVVIAFIIFIFVPPDRLSPATMPIVRFLAAIAAALAAYLFIGSMSVGGQLPFFRRLEVKALGSFAVFLVVLLLFFKGIPAIPEKEDVRKIKDPAATSSETLVPVPANSSTDTVMGAQPDTTGTKSTDTATRVSPKNQQPPIKNGDKHDVGNPNDLAAYSSNTTEAKSTGKRPKVLPKIQQKDATDEDFIYLSKQMEIGTSPAHSPVYAGVVTWQGNPFGMGVILATVLDKSPPAVVNYKIPKGAREFVTVLAPMKEGCDAGNGGVNGWIVTFKPAPPERATFGFNYSDADRTIKIPLKPSDHILTIAMDIGGYRNCDRAVLGDPHFVISKP